MVNDGRFDTHSLARQKKSLSAAEVAHGYRGQQSVTNRGQQQQQWSGEAPRPV